MPLRTPFFRPDPHWVGDLIPFSHGGVLYLYYLHERRQSPKPGTSWHLVTTEDLVTFTDHGEVLPHGDEDAADFNAYTGSVVTDDEGLHHLFYTGQNPRRTAPDGRPLQVVMHATGTDLIHWDKHPEHTVGAPEGYDPADFRDPFVYRTGPGQPWQLILAARHAEGPERRRGTVGRLRSTDLVRWQSADPLWDPHRFLTQECPEIFRIGDWWYLVYSEFTDAFQTRYRMSRSPEGPWHAPRHDTLDGRAFYAVKSAEWHGRRILAGWIASREGETDDGPWLWAGTLSLLEAVQRENGTLDVRIPAEVLAADPTALDAGLAPGALEAPTSYASRVGTTDLPARCTIRAELTLDPEGRAAGLLLRTDAEGEHGYVLRLEPRAGRMVLDRWPRPVTGTEQWQISGDIPHALDLERPADLSGPDHRLDLILEDDLLVACLDQRVVLSTRLYDHRTGRLGLFADDAAIGLRSLRVTTA